LADDSPERRREKVDRQSRRLVLKFRKAVTGLHWTSRRSPPAIHIGITGKTTFSQVLPAPVTFSYPSSSSAPRPPSSRAAGAMRPSIRCIRGLLPFLLLSHTQLIYFFLQFLRCLTEQFSESITQILPVQGLQRCGIVFFSTNNSVVPPDLESALAGVVHIWLGASSIFFVCQSVHVPFSPGSMESR